MISARPGKNINTAPTHVDKKKLKHHSTERTAQYFINVQLLYQKKHTGCYSPSQRTFQSRQFSHLPLPMYITSFVTQPEVYFFKHTQKLCMQIISFGLCKKLQESSFIYLPRTMKLPGGYECLPATIHSSKASINSRLTLSKSMTDIVFNTALLTPGKKEIKHTVNPCLVKNICGCMEPVWLHNQSQLSLKSTWLTPEEGRSMLCLKQSCFSKNRYREESGTNKASEKGWKETAAENCPFSDAKNWFQPRCLL